MIVVLEALACSRPHLHPAKSPICTEHMHWFAILSCCKLIFVARILATGALHIWTAWRAHIIPLSAQLIETHKLSTSKIEHMQRSMKPFLSTFAKNTLQDQDTRERNSRKRLRKETGILDDKSISIPFTALSLITSTSTPNNSEKPLVHISTSCSSQKKKKISDFFSSTSNPGVACFSLPRTGVG